MMTKHFLIDRMIDCEGNVKNYYLCAYGNQFRVSHKCSSEEEAARYCWGVVDGVTVLSIGPRNIRYLTFKRRAEFENKLRSFHHQRTGNLI